MQELSDKDKEILALAKTNFKANQVVLRKWNKTKPKDLDQRFNNAHEKDFAKRDCLNCANCCKTTSPIFRQPDIRRMAKALRLKESQLVAQYLKCDEDDDYVLKTSPCFNLLPHVSNHGFNGSKHAHLPGGGKHCGENRQWLKLLKKN